jgi:hypothetical protein
MRACDTHRMTARRTSVARISAGGFTLPQLAAAVALALAMALVVPAVAATIVHRRRVARAVADVTRIAAALREIAPGSLTGSPGPTGITPTASLLRTLAGPGELPKSPRFPEWLTGRSDTLASQLAAGDPPGMDTRPGNAGHPTRQPPEIGADPWGNRYLVNVGALSGDEPAGSGLRPMFVVWVLSAGANGIIETPFDQPGATATVGGDDVAARVWR